MARSSPANAVPVNIAATSPAAHALAAGSSSRGAAPFASQATRSNSLSTTARWRASRSSNAAQLGSPSEYARSARASGSVGSSCVCSSLKAWIRFSTVRRQRYAVASAATVLSASCRSPASSGRTLSSERERSSGRRPPRTIWKTCAMNSISRMPPGPSLILSAMSLRATSWLMSRFICRSASNTP